MIDPDTAAGILKRFGSEVKIRRVKLNLSRVDMATRSKLSPSYVGKLERGAANPTLDTIARMADALDASV